jgi:hypothetical protein
VSTIIALLLVLSPWLWMNVRRRGRKERGYAAQGFRRWGPITAMARSGLNQTLEYKRRAPTSTIPTHLPKKGRNPHAAITGTA